MLNLMYLPFIYKTFSYWSSNFYAAGEDMVDFDAEV